MPIADAVQKLGLDQITALCERKASRCAQELEKVVAQGRRIDPQAHRRGRLLRAVILPRARVEEPLSTHLATIGQKPSPARNRHETRRAKPRYRLTLPTDHSS
jgi:hypothetical protein